MKNIAYVITIGLIHITTSLVGVALLLVQRYMYINKICYDLLFCDEAAMDITKTANCLIFIGLFAFYFCSLRIAEILFTQLDSDE